MGRNMSNYSACPACGEEIDVVKAARKDECPECQTYFGDLLDADEHNPDAAGPYYEVEA